MANKYSHIVRKKLLHTISDIANFSTEKSIEEILDRCDKMMADMERTDLAQNLKYGLTLQFVERIQRPEKSIVKKAKD